jgi:hypothetical protein
MELRDRLLSSVENHKKLRLDGLLKLYSHERKFSVIRNLLVLKKEKWIKINKSYVEDGSRVRMPCVYRGRRQLYTQPPLFDKAIL